MKKIQVEAMLEVQDCGICTVVQEQVETLLRDSVNRKQHRGWKRLQE